MDGSDLLNQIKTAYATELDRLGSEKALIATTHAALDRDTVLETAAMTERRAADTFGQWAADESANHVATAFADVAAQERDHYERIAELGSVDIDDPAPDGLHEFLRSLESTDERIAAGLLARPLASSLSLLQVINFFVNEADRAGAATFRELRSETTEQVDRGVELLDSIEVTADAEAAAGEAISIVYSEYVEALEGMGIDPKPVC